jgi:hypothetical protein
MSRHLINADVGVFRSGKMDVMTIDGSRLQIPSAGVRGKSRVRGNEIRLGTSKVPRDVVNLPVESVTAVPCNAPSERDEIVIDVRPRGDPGGKTGFETQALLETSAIVVPLGYFSFALALALCNLLRPASTHAVCIGLSPLPMLCIMAHAIGIQSVWIAWGLVLCGWLTPSVCALWNVLYSTLYLVCLVSFAVAGCLRIVPALCLVVIALCGPLALNPRWTGLEPKFWMTVAFSFSVLACAWAYTGGGKIIYRVVKSGQ